MVEAILNSVSIWSFWWSWLHQLPAMKLQTNLFFSLNLAFLICKMKIIMPVGVSFLMWSWLQISYVKALWKSYDAVKVGGIIYRHTFLENSVPCSLKNQVLCRIQIIKVSAGSLDFIMEVVVVTYEFCSWGVKYYHLLIWLNSCNFYTFKNLR